MPKLIINIKNSRKETWFRIPWRWSKREMCCSGRVPFLSKIKGAGIIGNYSLPEPGFGGVRDKRR